MLTGLLDISSGSAAAFGLDVEGSIEELRKDMGVCP
jgi:ABC-type multidrug transport system ATPase subunit